MIVVPQNTYLLLFHTLINLRTHKEKLMKFAGLTRCYCLRALLWNGYPATRSVEDFVYRDLWEAIFASVRL